MIIKFAALACLIGFVSASGWLGSDYSTYGSSIGYGHGGYSTYVSPSYTPVVKTVYAAPVVAKPVIPAFAYAPYAQAVSSVSRYQVHSSPVIKSYPVVKSYVAPVVKSYVAAPVVKSYVAAPILKSYVAPVSSYSSYSSAYPIAVGHGYSGGYAGGYSGDYLGGYSGYGYGGYGSKYLW